MAKLHHIVIPVKDINKAKRFFLELGLKQVIEGRTPPFMKAISEMFADEICYLVDENGVAIDLVSFDKECAYGKGLAVAFDVDNLQQRWDSFKDDADVRYISPPTEYGEEASRNMGLKEGSFAFVGVNLGRDSNDGEEQPIELNELKPL